MFINRDTINGIFSTMITDYMFDYYAMAREDEFRGIKTLAKIDGIADMRNRLINLENETEITRWHDALTDKPEVNGEYIVVISQARLVTTLYYNVEKDLWHEGNDANSYTVNKWMELPNLT